MERRGVLRAALLWLAGCGAAWAASGATSLWLDVPFVAQQKEGCGDAAVAMVMQYWQQKIHRPRQAAVDTGAVLQELPPGRRGVSAKAMLRYFEQHNYRAFAYAGDWGEIEQEIAKGRPLIAALKPEGGEALHYVVVAGVDDADEVVLLNDPAQRKLLKEARAEFEHEWKATGNWTLLAVPKLQ
jgi:ABC-type bacteriocin/lantibiotic exporter with double-glycine peptidase domain